MKSIYIYVKRDVLKKKWIDAVNSSVKFRLKAFKADESEHKLLAAGYRFFSRACAKRANKIMSIVIARGENVV